MCINQPPLKLLFWGINLSICASEIARFRKNFSSLRIFEYLTKLLNMGVLGTNDRGLFVAIGSEQPPHDLAELANVAGRNRVWRGIQTSIVGQTKIAAVPGSRQ